jgi:hypothetical protein
VEIGYKGLLMSYKGEIKAIQDIPIGTPIEIVDLEPFTHTLDTTKPVLGIMNVLNQAPTYDGTKYPTVNIWNGERFIHTYLYGNKYNRMAYTGFSVDTKLACFKVLTGTKAEFLKSKWKENMFLTNSLPFTSTTFTSGSDPEIFVVDEQGEIIPAWTFLPDKKANSPTDEYGKVFWDGFQAEFTTRSTACLSWVVDSMHYGLKTVLTKARAVNPNAKLSISNVLPVNEDTLLNGKDEHVTFGCLPSLNAYNKKGIKIENARAIPFRFAGGHIHLGATYKDIIETVKMLDAVVGIFAVGAFANIDTPIRRKFYGLAGEYRRPVHGLEWRTLSNAWLCHPAITMCIFDMARYAASLGKNNSRRFIIDDSEDRIQKIINECDVVGARKIINKNAELYRLMARNRYSYSSAGDITLAIANNGVDSLLDHKDIVGNWNLDKVWTTHCDGAGKNFNLFCRQQKK